jgi:hypothetical protein
MSNQIDHITATALDDVCSALRGIAVDHELRSLREHVARARRILFGVALVLASASLKSRLIEAITRGRRELPATAASAHDRHVLSCLGAHATWLDDVDAAAGDAARAHDHIAKMPGVWWPAPPRIVAFAVRGAW